MWRWFVRISIALAVILGIASVWSFFVPPHHTPVFVAPVALVNLALASCFLHLTQRPPFTIFAHHVRAEISRPNGTFAVLRKTVELRPNHAGLDRCTFRDIKCSGAITALRVDPRLGVAYQQIAAGEHSICLQFHRPLRPFHRLSIWLEAECQDGFTSPRGEITVIVDHPTKQVAIEVTLPPARPPHNVDAIYRRAGKITLLPPPDVSGGSITWTHTNKFGRLPLGEYQVRWDW